MLVKFIFLNAPAAEPEDQPWFMDEKEQSSLARALRVRYKEKG